MALIPVQHEIQTTYLAVFPDRTRIPAMVEKRGPYLRKPKPAAKAGPKTNFVREWRENAEMTQEDLAAESGLSLGSISAYELGTNNPSLDALAKLEKAFGVPRGMILDVNPVEDQPLWSGYLRASETQKREIGRIVGALVGPPKRKK
jgi:transcriptional regulator with XRE-family HTH domain